MLSLRLAFAFVVLPFTVAADDTGCKSESSGDVNQDRIHATYWAYYDENTDITHARAQFRFGSNVGTTLILDGGASVEFDGKPMPFDALLDWHATELAGRVDNGTFLYVNVDGEQFENPVPAFSPIDFASPPASIARDRAYDLAWSGTPLVTDELVETIVANDANRFDFVRVDARGAGTTSVVLPASSLGQVAPGPAVLSFRRHRDFPLAEDSGAGGKITTTYQPVDHGFNLQ
ncbi:MAG: hypothetical protein SFX73_13270 [Kofleriaceae bacterium]|nr:hypothetical protein [Kofleriaceae bacterium]